MKAEEAHRHLETTTEDLFQEASKLYRDKVDQTIELRSHGKPPTEHLIESAIEQTNQWLLKAVAGLPWTDPTLPNHIIEWERGHIWAKYGLTDLKLQNLGKRTRLEVLRGTPLPILAALQPGDLEAASSAMLAMIQRDLSIVARKAEFATKLGRLICPYGVRERHCPHQETLSMVKGRVPTSTEELVFICTIDRCIKEPS